MLRFALVLILLTSVARAEESADTQAVTRTANNFFGAYLKSLEKGGGYEETIKWVEKNPIPTPEYKAALAKLYRDALKADPELGYGADAVICGQDWPDKGYKASRVWVAGALAFVLMTSREQKEDGMKVAARFVKIDNAWRLDGTGPLSGGALALRQEKRTDAELAKSLVGDWKEDGFIFTFLKNGKWSTEDGVGTWKIKDGVLFRSTSETKDQPAPIYVLNDTEFIFDDDEGMAHRLERAPQP